MYFLIVFIEKYSRRNTDLDFGRATMRIPDAIHPNLSGSSIKKDLQLTPTNGHPEGILLEAEGGNVSIDISLFK